MTWRAWGTLLMAKPWARSQVWALDQARIGDSEARPLRTAVSQTFETIGARDHEIRERQQPKVRRITIAS